MTEVGFFGAADLPSINRAEVLRYALCKDEAGIEEPLKRCLASAQAVLSCSYCARLLSVKVTGMYCDFGAFGVESKQLSAYFADCEKTLLFAATLGVPFDRLLQKTSRLNPSEGVLLQAIGAERIETLCDKVCALYGARLGSLKPRISPGYGDLPLGAQADIFAALNCEKHIGLTLTDSLLMIPTKSVSAFAAVLS